MTTQMISHRFSRLFDVSALTPPRDFVPIGRKPICLEIGAGKGKHALLFASQNPNLHLCAIERTHEKFTAFKKSFDAQTLTNLTPIHSDAIHWSAYALFPNQVQKCFILYPNPEPKNKNQRFLNMPFFEFLLSRMSPNGQIIIASNIGEYIQECQLLLETVWNLPYTKRQIESDSARTHFEVKYLARGEACWELVITKPTHYRTRFDETLPLSWLPQ